MENEKSRFATIIQNILLGSKRLASDVGELAWLEAQLAKQSLIKIAVLALLFLILFTVTWVTATCLVTVYLISVNYSLMQAISYILIAHGVLLLLTLILIMRAKSNMQFKATRRQLQQLKRRKDKRHE